MHGPEKSDPPIIAMNPTKISEIADPTLRAFANGLTPEQRRLIDKLIEMMLQPERVTGPTVAWWKMVFENDSASQAQFVGTSCGLCSMPTEFQYGEHNLEGGD